MAILDLHGFLKSKRGTLKVAKKTKPMILSNDSDDDDLDLNEGIFHGSHGSSWIRGRLLGQGGYGSVYLAKTRSPDSHLPSEFAVKSWFVDESSSLQSEKEILQHLQFSNIVRCYGHEITKSKSGREVYNLILEYCSGCSLHDHILKFGPLPESEVRKYTRDLVEGLLFIHGNFYLHCDIKPKNILLSPGERGWRVKIADFGLAKKMTAEVIGEGRGTAPYMSPELVNDELLDWPADIWAVGCVVVEMLTGKQAWSTDHVHRNDYEFELPEISVELSATARDFLERCFQLNPYRRTPVWHLVHHPFVMFSTL